MNSAAVGGTTRANSVSWPELEARLTTLLQQGCDDLEVCIAASQRQQLLEYVALLAKWNKAYNLTAVRDEAQMVVRHLLDSLAVVPYLTGKRLIDVGTGAGLPGIPLAILFPEREFHLLDSNGKKTRFLTQVKNELGLTNLQVVNSRVEAFEPGQPFDGITSRAFASLADFTQLTRHLGTEQTRWLA